MAINFPSSPSVNDNVVVGSVTYTWDGVKWAAVAQSGGINDGDRGDITVSSSGNTWTIDSSAVTSAKIADGTIVDGDISATAEIAVSKLANGGARQLLQTDAAGTGVEWTSNVDIPGTLDVTGVATFDNRLRIFSLSGSAPGGANGPSHLNIGGGSYNDTTTATSGTLAHAVICNLGDIDLSATNASVTYTNASTLYINGQPNASTNVTITNPYSLYINRGISFFGGNISFSLGTAALPSIYPGTDTNTGFWSPAADTLAISNGGTETLRTDSAQRLLIGSSVSRNVSGTGTSRLQVEGVSTTGGSSLSLICNAIDDRTSLSFSRTRGTTANSVTAVAANDVLGAIFFNGADGTSVIQGAAIIASCDGTPGTNDMPGRLVFSTTADGASAVTEAMRINSQQEVLIGTGLTRNANGGVLQLESGITFPATAVAATDANTLDDYEEGTFTPTIVGSTTPGTATYGTRVGRYTKIGNRVIFSIFLDYSYFIGTGQARVSLPAISSNSTSSNFHSVSVRPSNYTLTASNVMVATIINNVQYIQLEQVVAGGGAIGNAPVDAAATLVFSGQYETA